MLNEVKLIGRVGNDPQVKYLESGTAVCNCTLATSEKYKNQQGETVENTEWHDLEIWGKLANIFDQYVRKGDLLYISGSIKTDTWENEAGEKRSRKKIKVLSMKMLGSRSSNDSTAETPAKSNITQSGPSTASVDINEEDDGDLPF
jgi:single-strand DNA-binding protein